MKTELQVTSIKQSKKLIDAGINPESATTFAWKEDRLYPRYVITDLDKSIPAWTTADLIDLLPDYIEKDKDSYRTSNAVLQIDRQEVQYIAHIIYDGDMTVKDYYKSDNALIENLVDAVIDICGKKKHDYEL